MIDPISFRDHWWRVLDALFWFAVAFVLSSCGLYWLT